MRKPQLRKGDGAACSVSPTWEATPSHWTPGTLLYSGLPGAPHGSSSALVIKPDRIDLSSVTYCCQTNVAPNSVA